MVRADNSFSKPEIYELCEEKDVHFLIRLKSNKRLQAMAEELVAPIEVADFIKTEVHYFSVTDYQAVSWKKPYRVIIQATRAAGECLFHHAFFVTNFKELFPKQLLHMYQNRGTMENFIKEAKSGFLDKTGSQANTFRLLMSSVAYNLIQCMKQMVFPEKEKNLTIETIHFHFFKVAAKFVSHVWKWQIQLVSSHVFQASFREMLRNIQKLPICVP